MPQSWRGSGDATANNHVVNNDDHPISHRSGSMPDLAAAPSSPPCAIATITPKLRTLRHQHSRSSNDLEAIAESSDRSVRFASDSNSGELIFPAPEASSEVGDPKKEFDVTDDSSSMDLEMGQQHMANDRDNEQETAGRRSSLRETMGRGSSRLAGIAKSSSIAMLQRGMSSFFRPKHMSLAAQRYNRQATTRRLIQSKNISVISTEFVSSMKMENLSEDTKHRLKGFACCVLFGFVLVGLLYLLIKR